MKYIFKKLEGDEINEALSLAYKCYVECLNWNPPEQNPSEYRIAESPDGHKILADKYIEKSVYYGLYDDGRMIATGRTICGDLQGMEFSNYIEVENLNRLKKDFDGACTEINRVCIHPDYLQSEAIFLLFSNMILDGLERFGEAMFVAIQFPNPGEILLNFLFENIDVSVDYGDNSKNELICLPKLNLDQIVQLKRKFNEALLAMS